MTDLLALISRDIPLKKVANTHGGEWVGMCIFCKAGVDRFHVWPNATRPGWWCRMCERGGDAIQYLREQGMSYQDACVQVGVPLDRPTAPPSFVAPPVACVVPPQAWRAAGAGLVLWSQGHIEQARAYLHTRGLTDTTISAAGLGYNPAGRWSERAKWGMSPDEEKNTRVWIPQGVVIPWYAAGALWKISIRRDVVKEEQERYKTLPGSANVLYNADALQSDRPAVLVEGVFDALAVQQVAGDLCGIVASGTSGARRIRWITQLALCSDVLIALDADTAGDTAARYWLDVLPNGKRWRPYYADPAQMLEDEQDVRGWLLAGLDKRAAPWALDSTSAEWQAIRDYWQAEVAQGTPALVRLEQVCREQGYDYPATRDALQ